MARKKNCDKRRQENLPKLPPKKPVVSRRPTVEDVTDSESDESDEDFTLMDSVASSDLFEDHSEFDMESDDEDVILKEIRTDSELLAFVSRLQKPHDQMVMKGHNGQQRKGRQCIWEIQTGQNEDGRQKAKRRRQLASPP
jgi:hypothetical protein